MSAVIPVMATLACAIITPAAGALLLLPSSSSAFAQEQEETSLGEGGEDLAGSIAPDVLDNVDVGDEEEEEENNEAAATRDNDDTSTQIAVSITDQDQRC